MGSVLLTTTHKPNHRCWLLPSLSLLLLCLVGGSCVACVPPCGPKAPCTPVCVIQVLNHLHWWCLDAFQHQLGNAVALVDCQQTQQKQAAAAEGGAAAATPAAGHQRRGCQAHQPRHKGGSVWFGCRAARKAVHAVLLPRKQLKAVLSCCRDCKQGVQGKTKDSSPLAVVHTELHRTCEVLVFVVEQQHPHLTPVVLIDYSCPNIDKVVDCQPGAGCHAAICAGRGVDGDACLDQLPAACWDDCVFRAAGKVAGKRCCGVSVGARRQPREGPACWQHMQQLQQLERGSAPNPPAKVVACCCSAATLWCLCMLIQELDLELAGLLLEAWLLAGGLHGSCCYCVLPCGCRRQVLAGAQDFCTHGEGSREPGGGQGARQHGFRDGQAGTGATRQAGMHDVGVGPLWRSWGCDWAGNGRPVNTLFEFWVTNLK